MQTEHIMEAEDTRKRVTISDNPNLISAEKAILLGVVSTIMARVVRYLLMQPIARLRDIYIFIYKIVPWG